jgi:hypothetical protein
MLRHHQSIRLSRVDHELFAAVTGTGLPAPKTVVDYNERLRLAAQSWSRGRSANDRYLATVALGLMLDATDPTAVLDNGRLALLKHH